jgi:spore coat polysaccharide biosynthesis protein SpsF (cytidylyltransferase family)
MFKYIFADIPEILENKQEIRLTVDTKTDFENTRQIYSKVMRKNIKLNLINLLNLIKEEPKIISRMKIQIQKNAK